MEIVILIGVQGAGKSLFVQQRFEATHGWVSLDRQRTRGSEQAYFQASLQAGRDIVVDNTNTTRAARSRYLEPALAAGYRAIAYYFDLDRRAAIARNNARAEGKVPVPALLKTYKQREPPLESEGFSERYRVLPKPGGEFIVEAWTDAAQEPR